MAFRTNKVPAIEERTVSGSSVSFNSAFALPLKACKVSFSATQAGSGDPSPSNPRAISGVSAIGLMANSTPVSVSLGDTRYGGYVDLVRKKLVVTDRINLIKNSGDRAYDANNQTFRFLFNDMYVYPSTWIMPNVKTSIYKTVETRPWTQWNIAPDFCISTRATLSYIVIKDSRYASMVEYLTDMGDLEIIYPLATPIEISLSDIPDLSSIIGNNTFSTDTGTLEITFADLQEKSASGAVASFNTALAMPLVSCNIAVNAWQEGSGDPSPVNVRPIHGFSEVNATRCGVNLWDEEWELGVYSSSADGEPSPSQKNIRSKSTNYILVTPNTTYYFHTNGYSMDVYQYASDMSFIGKFRVTDQSRQVDANCYYLRFNMWSSYGVTYNHDISINYPSTDTDYHAYTGNIYPIQLGQEVYGAEVDVVNGVAHCTHGIADLGEQNWSYNSNTLRFDCTTSASLRAKRIYGSEVPNALCSIYKVVRFNGNSSATGADNSLFFDLNLLRVRNKAYTDAALFKTDMSGIMLIYELATPFDIQLTPTQIETLIGNNTIFADTGDIDLTYKDLDIAKRGNFREVFKLPS